MLSKLFRGVSYLLVSTSLLSLGYFRANIVTQTSTNKTDLQVNAADILIGTIYTQPIDPSGQLFLSSWLDPDGSDFDQKVWDNFTLPSDQTVTEIDWFGVYDPARSGGGGAVLDFTVAIYPSIAAGTEPAVANPPLVEYQTGGNAGETSIGTVGGNILYAYAFGLSTPFTASAGTKYWVYIVASQGGSIPDWCLVAGTGGDGSHYRWGSGAGGDSGYRTVPGDAAFALLGPVPDTATPTDTLTATETPTDTATNTSTNTATFTPTATNTFTPTNTNTFTPTSTHTFTPSATNTFTPTSTYTFTPTNTNTFTPTSTNTFTPTATNTSTFTSTPILSVPGKVTGGGTIGFDKKGARIIFGFNVNYSAGDSAPNGNLTYQDHKNNLRLKATFFDLLLIEGDHAWFTGTGIMNDRRIVKFEIEINASNKMGKSDTFYIYIPALNDYEAGGALTGGNITIH